MAHSPRGWTGARTPSAIKRVRSAERRNAVNQPRRSEAKTLVSRALKVASGALEGDPGVALATAMSALDKAAKVGAIHPNAAARRKSRLALKLNALATGGQPQVAARTARTLSKAAALKAAKTRIATSKATKAKGAQTAAGKARAALSKTARAEAAAKSTAQAAAPAAAPTKAPARAAKAAATAEPKAAAKPAAKAAPKAAAAAKPAAKPAAKASTTKAAAPKAAKTSEAAAPKRTAKPKATKED